MELPDRRQKEAEWHGYVAIDDSYNISLTTARAGVEAAVVLAKREGKKLLVVTAGIPELGPAEKIGNEKLGELIASRADRAAILKSIFASEIIKGIRAYEKITARNGKNFSVFEDLSTFLADAHEQFPTEQWIVLVQPELTDLYY
jgi:UDP-N-acetylmuramyl pentapeptide synthase